MVERHLTIEPAPEGWTDLQLADLCDRVQESVQPVEGGRTPYVGLEHLASGAPVLLGHGVDGDVTSSKAGFSAGDVLFGKLRPYLRKGAQPDFDGVCSTDILVFRAKDPGTPEYLKYMVHSDQFIEHAKATTSGVQHPRTSWSSLREFKVTLPPSHEQQHIAQVLSTVQQAIEQQERLIRTTTELKQALMQKLFTEGLRGEAQKETEIGLVPESWEVVQLQSLADVRGGKRLPKGNSLVTEDTGYPYIRVTDFDDNSVTTEDVLFVPTHLQQGIKRYIIHKDDVYISVAGSIGLVGMIPEELDGANLTENANKLVILDQRRIAPRYLMYWLAAEYCQAEIKSQTLKNAQPKLSLGRIKTLAVALPSRKDQDAMVDALDSVRNKIKVANRKKTALQDLFRTLLHELMTGKVRVGDMPTKR